MRISHSLIDREDSFRAKHLLPSEDGSPAEFWERTRSRWIARFHRSPVHYTFAQSWARWINVSTDFAMSCRLTHSRWL